MNENLAINDMSCYAIKDASYYEDLIYELKKITGINQPKNQLVEARILKRINATIRIEYEKGEGNFKHEYRMSTFQQDLMDIFRKMIRKQFDKENSEVGTHAFATISDINIFRYPRLHEYVYEELNELEQKMISLKSTSDLSQKKKRNKKLPNK